MTDAERAALERKISEMREEWESVEMTGGTNGAFDDVKTPRPWTSDERANAVLRNEMPMPDIWKNPNGMWTCEPNMECGEGDEVIESGPEYMDAVALAWVAMKGPSR